MSNPIVVEALRGERIESFHRGAGAVLDAAGRVVFAFGDVERPIYPRSAVKALQALPLIESGAADRLGLTEAEIALACASHGGTNALGPLLARPLFACPRSYCRTFANSAPRKSSTFQPATMLRPKRPLPT